MYYILSLKWTKAANNKLFIWWKPKDSGYTTDLDRAGKYTKEQVEAKLSYYNNGESTLAVPCEAVDVTAARMVPTDYDLELSYREKAPRIVSERPAR